MTEGFCISVTLTQGPFLFPWQRFLHMAACFTRGGSKVIVKRWLEGMKAPNLETAMVTVDCHLTRSRTTVSQSSEHPCEGTRFVDIIKMERPTLNVNFFKKKIGILCLPVFVSC